MTKADTEREVRVLLYESNEIKLYKEGDKVVFSHTDHGNDEDESNCSFSQAVEESVFKEAIAELLKTGRCVLFENPEFKFEKQGQCLCACYRISDYLTVHFFIEDFDFSRLSF